MATPPTASDIRLVSRVPFDDLGWPTSDDVDVPDLLQDALDSIIPWVEDVTGYAYDPGSGQYAIEERNLPRFQKAIRMAAEFEAYKGQADAVEDLTDFAEIQAMSAGSYSETRRSVSQAMRAQAIHPWPALAALLGQLMHPTKKLRAEAPAVGWSDPLRRPGEDIMNAGLARYNPFNMGPAFTLAPVTPWVND